MSITLSDQGHWWSRANASVETVLDTCRHIWPDRDESTRAAIDAVITTWTEQRRNSIEATS